MTFQTIKYKTFALLAGAVLVCGGCHHSDEPCPPEEPGKEPPVPAPEMVNLCLNVFFEGQKSRADEPDGYEKPAGTFENVSSLRVIIIRNIEQRDDDDNPTGIVERREVEANRLVATNDAGYPKHDNLEFEVVADETKLIYLIANESSLQATQNILEEDGEMNAKRFINNYYEVGAEPDLDLLTNWTVSIPKESDSEIITKSLFSDSKALIPMLPLTEFFNIKVDAKTAVDDTCYSNLFITRAAAKATFLLDPAGLEPYQEQDIRITSISLVGVCSEEYVFPNNTEYSLGKYQGDGKPNSSIDKTYITTFATPKASEPLTYLLNFSTEENPGGMSLDIAGTEPVDMAGPIYFPESILAKDQYYEVAMTLSNGIELKSPLVTTEQNIANILNINGCEAIARNTHLKIVIKISNKELSCEVRVAPYVGIELNPNFGWDELIKPPKPREQPNE
ncbi:MAG: hypothetical protein K2K45_09550 [Muribaculaceae bacterium]|nr:hypothetical protein [Muribaculaceae bacterium]